MSSPRTEFTNETLKDRQQKVAAGKQLLEQKQVELAVIKGNIKQEEEALQREFLNRELDDKKRYDGRMIALNKQVTELKAKRLGLSESHPYVLYREQVAGALAEFCKVNNGSVYRAGDLISYAELDVAAKLVEDTLVLAKNVILDSTQIDQLHKNYKAIEEKARELEGSKHIFDRKTSKALIGVGVALMLGALTAFILFLSPVILPILATAGIGAGISILFVIPGCMGIMLSMIGYGVPRRDSDKMPLLSQSLFKFRDTIKDINAGRDPNDFSLRKIARLNR